MNLPSIMSFVPWGLLETGAAGIIIKLLLDPLYDHLNIQQTSKVRVDMQAALQNSLNYGVQTLKNKGVAPEKILEDNGLWNDLLDASRDYLDENADSMLRKLGLDPNSSAVTKALEAQVLTIINQYVYQNGQIKAVVADPTQSTPGTMVSVITARAP